MKKHIPVKLSIILSGLIVFLISCAPGSCFEVTESFVKASFYNNTTKILQAPDSLTVYGLNMETNKLYNNILKVQPALLPLNASADTCKYIIKINGVADTLEFRYSSYPHLISKECGYTFYHNIDTVISTTNTIFYIYISNSNVTTVNEENIRIFY